MPQKKRTSEKQLEEIWRRKCGPRASGLAEGRRRRQHKAEFGRDEWSVAYDTLGAIRHKSSELQFNLPTTHKRT